MTSSDCDSCTESLLEILESSNNICNFILLMDKYEYANLRGRLVKSSIIGNVFVFEPDSFRFKEVGMPYMFFLDNHHRMNNIYIPLKELPDLTIEYLKKKV